MRCFTTLAIVLACLTHCLAHNAVAAKTPRKSDVSQTKLCELVLQKLELSQRSDEKKTLIPIDNIIYLLEIIKKSGSKESGQAVEKSGLKKDLEKESESAENGTRRSPGRFHWRPKHLHRNMNQVLETLPEVIRVIKSRPEYDDPPDDEVEYLESSYYYPTERRLDVNPPPIVPITRSSIQLDDFQVDEEPKKAESEAKGSLVKQPLGTKNRLSDVSENAKATRSPRQQGSNDTLDVLKHLMGNSGDNAKVTALLKTLIANQKAASIGEKKETVRPEVAKTVRKVDVLRKINSKDSKDLKAKTEPAQAAPSDKKLSSRRNKPNTKGRDIPDEASPRLGIQDDWEWDSEPLVNYVPRNVNSKVHLEDENVNKNMNVNTNTDTRIPRVSSRRSYGTRTHRLHDRHNVDRNTNVNTNTNTDTNEILTSGPGVDRFVSMRRSLDHFLEDDLNSNVNTNINTNSNSNRPVLSRNNRRGRELRRLV